MFEAASYCWLLIHGFVFGASLVVALGPQNFFVIQQGLKREHLLAVIVTSSICDALLISLGAYGQGSFLNRFTLIKSTLLYAGVLYLSAFSIFSVASAKRLLAGDVCSPGHQRSLVSAVSAALGFSVLNPHAVIDTTMLIGGYASTLQGAGVGFFAIGAIACSALWFTAIGYGARRFTTVLEQPRALVVLHQAGALTSLLAACLLFFQGIHAP